MASLKDMDYQDDAYNSALIGGGNILEEDQLAAAQNLKHETNTGGTKTIRDLVSFKTEVKSLIGNLQETTQD